MLRHAYQTRAELKRKWALLTACAVLAVVCGKAQAQASPAGIRAADLQIGAAYVYDNPDYTPQKWTGAGLYLTFDFKPHWGVEFELRQAGHSYPYPANTSGNPTPYSFTVNAYQRDYEFGPRYVRHYGRFHPYAKVLYGRGVQNFPEGVSAGKNGAFYNANLAYNMGAAGLGVDVNVHRHVNVRADYEFQHWFSFPSAAAKSSLAPSLLSIGAAYHF